MEVLYHAALLVCVVCCLYLTVSHHKISWKVDAIFKNQQRQRIVSEQCDVGDAIFEELRSLGKGAYRVRRQRKDSGPNNTVCYCIWIQRRGAGTAEMNVVNININFERAPHEIDVRTFDRERTAFESYVDPNEVRGMAEDAIMRHAVHREFSGSAAR